MWVLNYCNRWRLKANVREKSWSLPEIRKKGSGCRKNIDCLECVAIDT